MAKTMINKLQKVWKNRLVKNVLMVASGTAGAQAIGMAFIPFITRTYGPETYGMLGAFIAITGILTTFATLGYSMAIVLPKNDSAAKSLVKLSFFIAVITSLFMLISLWLAGDFIMIKLGATNLIDFMFFIPVAILLIACQEITQQWLIRKKHFRHIANISIIHSSFNYGFQALVGLYSPLAVVLIFIHTLAIAIRSALAGYVGIKIDKLTINKSKKGPSLKKMAYIYRDFPLYRAPQALLNAVSQGIPILMLTAFFGPASAGFYTLTRTVLGLPSTLLGSSVESVFYPHFNEVIKAKDKSFPLLLKATAALAIVGVWPFFIVILFGPLLFEFVFGKEWQQAGEYARWLATWLFFGLISRPSISSIAIFKIQRWFLGYEIVSVILRIIAMYIGYTYFSSSIIAIAIFSILGVILNIYLIVNVFLTAKKNDVKID